MWKGSFGQPENNMMHSGTEIESLTNQCAKIDSIDSTPILTKRRKDDVLDLARAFEPNVTLCKAKDQDIQSWRARAGLTKILELPLSSQDSVL